MITLAVLSTVAPGSAHLIRGNRRIGRIIVRSYLVLLAVAVLLLGAALITKRPLLELALRPELLLAAQYGAIGIAVAWCLVIISSAVAGGAVSLAERQRRVAVVVVAALCLAVVAPLTATARLASAQRGLVNAVFADDPAPSELPERLNILLLGGDGAPDRQGVRTDSIHLASIDTETGRAVMFSLPRNLQNAPFPADSPLHQRFPHGFDCGDECLLNALHTYGTENPSLLPDARDPGAEAVKQAVSATLGLDVHYYVLVNMAGFRSLVDALGGVKIHVQERVPIGGIGPDGRPVPPKGYIEPGLRTLNGYEALWFARSRADSNDYARMSRQRCVISAILEQADPWRVLRNYEAIAASAKNVVSTDVPRDLLPDLVELAVKTRNERVTNVQFVPPRIKPSDPDFPAIRSMVENAIEVSQRSGSSAKPGSEPTNGSSDRENGANGVPTGGEKATHGGDGSSGDGPVELDSACA